MDQYFWFGIFVLLNAIILYVLTANVSRLRLKLRVSVGDGGHNALIYAMRAHSNGVEQVPIFGFIILALSLLAASGLLLMALVLAFSLARVLHAYGMCCKVFICRRIGASMTYLLQLAGVLALAYSLFV
jgi:uncharacterized membrane protein YecN with MAPEG domain